MQKKINISFIGIAAFCVICGIECLFTNQSTSAVIVFIPALVLSLAGYAYTYKT